MRAESSARTRRFHKPTWSSEPARLVPSVLVVGACEANFATPFKERFMTPSWQRQLLTGAVCILLLTATAGAAEIREVEGSQLNPRNSLSPSSIARSSSGATFPKTLLIRLLSIEQT